MKKFLSLILLPLSLAACSIFQPYGTSNVQAPEPVAHFVPTVFPHVLWQMNVGSGSNGDYLPLAPAASGGVIYTIDQNGTLTATSIAGVRLWKQEYPDGGKSNLASDDSLLAFVDSKAVLHVQSTDQGKKIWQATLSDQALAAPTLTPQLILVKTIDGAVTAFDRMSGQMRWQYQHDAPTLMLRASSAPVVVGSVAYVGFADGKVVALSLDHGDELWSVQVAEPQGFAEIERMVDIDAALIPVGDRLYVATYQGQVAALQRSTGKILWQQANSVYANIAYDGHALYAVHADGTFTAYDHAGKILWRQKNLAWHFLTGPAVYHNALVVGDVEGKLYFINTTDGAIIGRIGLYARANIINTPLVVNQSLVVIDTKGKLSAVR